MRNEYPASEKLKQAITALFEDPANGFIALGIGGFPGAAKGQPADPQVSYTARVTDLRKKLEEYVALYAAEVEEFEAEADVIRIRSEARAILMVLREVHRAFPEVS